MLRVAARFALLLCVLACGDLGATRAAPPSESPWHCEIRGRVTIDGRAVTATVVATRYAGVEALAFWNARMPGYEAPEVPDGDRVGKASTTADGRYRLRGLAPGCYAVTARDGAGHVAEVVLACHADGVRREIDLKLVAARTLTGRLTWRGGTAITGKVVLRARRQRGRATSGPYNPWWHAEDDLPDGPKRGTRIDVQGGFRFEGLPPDAHAIRVETGDGFVLHGWEPWRPKGEPIVWAVPRAALAVTGRLIDARTGRPIPSARVEARDHVRHKATLVTRTETDVNGAFRILVQTLPAALHCQASGYQDLHEAALTGDEGNLALAPAEHLSGRVVQADGQPAAGARVVLAGTRWRSTPSTLRVATSRSDGRFELSDVPPGERVVFVRGGGWVSSGLSDIGVRGRNPFLVSVTTRTGLTLRVEAAAHLDGRVVDHRGQALGGASVRALGTLRARHSALFRGLDAHNACVGPAVVATMADGRFHLPDLVPGLLYEIRITAPGQPVVRVGPQPAAAPNEALEIRVPKPRWLDLVVRDEATGEPVDGASAQLYVDDGRPRWMHMPPTATTNEDGRARFGPVRAGAVSVWLHHRDYIQPTQQFAAKPSGASGDLVVTAALRRGLTITGRLVDAAGKPVASALVRARFLDEGKHLTARVASGVDGTFRLTGLQAGRYVLGVAAGGRGEPKASTEAEAGARNVVITLSSEANAAPRAFVVRVQGPAGEAIAAADVSLETRSRTFGGRVRSGEARFEIPPGLFEGKPFRVFVSRPRDPEGRPLPFGRQGLGPIGPGVKSVDVRLVAERVIDGTVVDEAGSPVSGARVQARVASLPGRRGAPAGSTRADAKGRFRLGQLGPGSHTLTVEAGVAFIPPKPVEVHASASGVVMRLQRGATARLVIVDPEGRPSAAARVRAHPNRQMPGDPAPVAHPGRGVRGRSAADGSVILHGLAAGRSYDLEVVPSSARPDLQVLRIRAWKPVDATLRLEAGMSVGGEVLDADGQLVKGARIRIQSEHLSGGISASDGRFRRMRLPPGRYTLTASGPDTRDVAGTWKDDRLPSITVTATRMDIVLVLRRP